ncbi:unnamed protein product [Dicrocoelium dendriticum]|nr:unnamed protein product [Dicrocoelium dendriticum]
MVDTRYFAMSNRFSFVETHCSACACFINRLGQTRTTIAVDGAFFRFSSTFPVILVETITRLIPYSYTFKLKLIDDGIGKGAAAIIAAHKLLTPVQPRFTIFM